MSENTQIKRFTPECAEPINPAFEDARIMDIRDPKWAHPMLADDPVFQWDQSATYSTWQLWDPSKTDDEKAALANAILEASLASYGLDGDVEHRCDISSYTVPGCPEEPETTTEVRVYRPKSLDSKKARVIYFVIGGGLAICSPDWFPLEDIACEHNCVVVTAFYRCSWAAKYPAAMNDIHAGYQWMYENAKMLGINRNNVVIYGLSSGGHLALSLGFRLKRYGYKPKGIVAFMPQTDDRETDHRLLFNGAWDNIAQRDAMKQWMGDAFASSLVGPEAFANHATVEDCKGYAPCFIHTCEFDPDRHFNREFHGKLLDAGSFTEYHVWGGTSHMSAHQMGITIAGEANEFSARVKCIVDGNIEDCFNYDLRRPWTAE